MEKMYVFNRIYPFKEKISLAKPDLTKLSNEDMLKLYDITRDRNTVLNFKKTLLSNKAKYDYSNFNIYLEHYNVYLKLLDNIEQEILQKTL